MIAEYIAEAALGSSMTVGGAISTLRQAGGLRPPGASLLSEKVASENHNKWFNRINTICRSRNDINMKIKCVLLLEEGVIQLQQGILQHEVGKKYCDLLLYLLRQNENLRVRLYSVVVFARLIKLASTSPLVDLRKSAGTYASQSLPLIVHLITVSAMPMGAVNTVDSTKDSHVDFKVVCLYALSCIMDSYPSSTRSPPRKMVRTINTMVGHVDPNVQVKAAECYAAFTFAKQNSESWTKQILLLLSNLDAIIECCIKGNPRSSQTNSSSDGQAKFIFKPNEILEKDVNLDCALRGIALCIEKLLLHAPKYFMSIPICFPLITAVDVIDKLVLACITISTELVQSAGRVTNEAENDGSMGSVSAIRMHTGKSISLVCSGFAAASKLFQAIFRSVQQNIIRNYNQVSLIITSLLRWSRNPRNQRFSGPILSIFEILYSFFKCVGPCLKKNFVENAAYYCLESFSTLLSAESSTSASPFSSPRNKNRGTKRSRGKNSWKNLKENSSGANDSLNESLLKERLVLASKTLNCIVVHTSPKLGSFLRKLIHEKLYDIFNPMNRETRSLNAIIMCDRNARKSIYELLLSCTIVQTASNVPSLFTFTNMVLSNGLNDADSDIVRICRTGKLSLINMVKPSSIPFQSFVREIPTIAEKVPEQRWIEVGSVRDHVESSKEVIAAEYKQDSSEAAPVALTVEDNLTSTKSPENNACEETFEEVKNGSIIVNEDILSNTEDKAQFVDHQVTEKVKPKKRKLDKNNLDEDSDDDFPDIVL